MSNDIRPNGPSPSLQRDRACVLIVDAQERLAPAMEPQAMARVQRYATVLVEAAREMGLPILASEQYPKGLGPTIEPIRQRLPSAPLAKLAFSCGADAALRDALCATGRRQIVLAGMETHVCVFQTARDLVAQGYEVHVCADAVASRTEEHRRVGLDLAARAGALVTTAETAIFDLLQMAGTPEFKRISALVK